MPLPILNGKSYSLDPARAVVMTALVIVAILIGSRPFAWLAAPRSSGTAIRGLDGQAPRDVHSADDHGRRPRCCGCRAVLRCGGDRAIVRPAIALWILGLVVVLGAAGVAWTATDGTAPSGNAIVASAVGPTLPAFTAALLIRSTYFKTS